MEWHTQSAIIVRCLAHCGISWATQELCCLIGLKSKDNAYRNGCGNIPPYKEWNVCFIRQLSGLKAGCYFLCGLWLLDVSWWSWMVSDGIWTRLRWTDREVIQVVAWRFDLSPSGVMPTMETLPGDRSSTAGDEVKVVCVWQDWEVVSSKLQKYSSILGNWLPPSSLCLYVYWLYDDGRRARRPVTGPVLTGEHSTGNFITGSQLSDRLQVLLTMTSS